MKTFDINLYDYCPKETTINTCPMKPNRIENNKRIEVLYTKHYTDLIKYANTLTHNEQDSEDIVSNIITNLIDYPNPRLYYKDSFNLYYLNKTIYSKFINDFRLKNKQQEYIDNVLVDEEYTEYDAEKDKLEEELLNCYIQTINETKNIDKYANLYIKYRLYGLSISNCINISGKNKDTIYSHFSKLNKWVTETYKIKSEIICKNLLI